MPSFLSERWKALNKTNCYSLAGHHKGPTPSTKKRTLNPAFELFPEAIEPALSRKNQERTPIKTARRTASGALSYTQLDSNQMVTPHPNKNPPVSADKNRVSGEA